eukprot:TRINITY_DN21439_c0_g1_i1.p1 TRINITY_DN21439_c0_g1~~TRINITY_DN21439_c0_g1_i1.p1  ORF type:complete len:1005 (+),score=243.66 TRINITY_DN21439_c0_g1_i1:69-3017(+)
MGVPAFFKWLIHKYPKVLVPAREEPMGRDEDGDFVPPDLDGMNPNNVEFDNLYIDMNGMVHPCCHDCVPLPRSEEEMMMRIFAALDEVIGVVRPRKLLYLALDGCAPRAKLNQQRARRYRTARDLRETRDMETQLAADLVRRGCAPPLSRQAAWDQNVITPGTEFMEKLSKALRWYIHERCNSDPFFQKLVIVFSDSTVPGEGEHKIFNFIRAQRRSPGFRPNTRHCIYGLDADLIFLALATHEPYFSVLREHIDWSRPNERGRSKLATPPGISNYDLLHCNVIREYLEADMAHLRQRALPMAYDFERCLDDFIFICFFVGNDFLPSIPSLEIREGGLDILIDFYNQNLEHLGGYLSDCGEVNMRRVGHLLRVIGDKEERILGARVKQQERRSQRQDWRIQQDREWRAKEYEDMVGGASVSNKSTNEVLADLLANRREESNDIQGRYSDAVDYSNRGWKERYYQVKFGRGSGQGVQKAPTDAAREFLVGVQWIMRYYFQGTASWDWFYPYHYAPFAADICDVALEWVQPEPAPIGVAGRPFDQLVGLLPPSSRHALPHRYRWLMTEKTSPVAEHFSEDFHVDFAGKRFAWMGTVILPFIPADKLLAATAPIHERLSPEEKRRNTHQPELVFVHRSHPLGASILRAHSGKGLEEVDEPAVAVGGKRPRGVAPVPPAKHRRLQGFTEGGTAAKIKRRFKENMFSSNTAYAVLGDPSEDAYSVLIDDKITYRNGLAGWVRRWDEMLLPGETYCRGYDELDVDDVDDCQVVGAVFQLPAFRPHVPLLLPGVITPKPELTANEKAMVNSGHVFEWIGENPNANAFPRQARQVGADTSVPPSPGSRGPGAPGPGRGYLYSLPPARTPEGPPIGRGSGVSQRTPGYGPAWGQPMPPPQPVAGKGERGWGKGKGKARPVGAAPGVVSHTRPHAPPEGLMVGNWAAPEQPVAVADVGPALPPPPRADLPDTEVETVIGTDTTGAPTVEFMM